MINNIEHRRVALAFQQVQTIVNENFSDKYSSYTKKLPILIKTNGLAQALAFALSKTNDNNTTSTKEKDEALAWKCLLHHLFEWLKEREFIELPVVFKEIKEAKSSKEQIEEILMGAGISDNELPKIYEKIDRKLKPRLSQIARVSEIEDIVNKFEAFESGKYRLVMMESMVYLKWLSRFADGLIEDSEVKAND